MATSLWLVRHGETRWSRERLHTSVTDVPLTAAGVAAARAVGERLAGRPFALVLTSPRQRARHSAELAGFPGAEYRTIGWGGILAPANVPAPVLAKLEQEARAAAQTTAMKARFQVFGMQPLGTTGAEFRRDVEATAPVVERLIRLSGARVE